MTEIPKCDHCGTPANIGCDCTDPDLPRAVIPQMTERDIEEIIRRDEGES